MVHPIDGFINLDKPPGKTSFQMVSLVRRLSGVRKVGHSGTLDPDATGVLPILIGKATSLASFVTDSLKVYRAEIELGRATDTYDASGRITQEGDISDLGIERIDEALEAFRGTIQQIPPMYSAIKHQGRPLYLMARAGLEVERKPRSITVSRLSLLEWTSPVLSIEVECSKGTYIRSLAHDLGQVLKCGAHLKGLRRLRTGQFDIEASVTVPQVEEGFQSGDWRAFVQPLDTVLMHLGSVVADEVGEQAVACGRPLEVGTESVGADGELRRAYRADGRLLAIVRLDQEQGLWRPKRVFI